MEFNFAFFYNLVVKKNTPRKQYDAVYLLLLGDTRADYESHHQFDESYIEISDSASSNYTSGALPIRQEILGPLLGESLFEYARRLKLLRLPHARKTACALQNAILAYTDSSDFADLPIHSDEEAYSFLSQAFQRSLCAPDSIRLSKEQMQDLVAFRVHSTSDQDPEAALLSHTVGSLNTYLGCVSYEEYQIYVKEQVSYAYSIIDQHKDSVPDILPTREQIPFWKFSGTYSMIQRLIYDQKIFETLPAADIFIDLPPMEELLLQMMEIMRAVNRIKNVPYILRSLDINQIEITIFMNPAKTVGLG